MNDENSVDRKVFYIDVGDASIEECKVKLEECKADIIEAFNGTKV